MTESKIAEEVQEQVEQLRKWMDQQPHLPKDMDDKLLRRFLHSCYYDMERTQKTIENFTAHRIADSDLFGNRNLNSAEFQKALKIVKFGMIKSSDNKAIWLKQVNDPGLSNFDYVQDTRLSLLTMDAWLLDDESPPDSDIFIMDMKDVSFRIFTKISLSAMKKLSKYQEEALPIRLKGIHLVNVPSFMDKLFSLLKLFLNRDMTDMMHFHVANSNTLYDFISRDDLPKDFGGNLVSLDEMTEKVVETVHRHREKLCSDTLWKPTEEVSKMNMEVPVLSTITISAD